MNELISNGYELDLTENIPVPLNYAIADVKDPSKRQRNFSKEIELPDTIVNRSFFSGAFGLNVTDNTINFDATAKTEAILKKNGIPILPNGLIKLNSVTRTNGNLKYSITLFSETVDIFLLLSNIRINELDWSAYDHTLTQANITASWSTASGSGYRYPLIERGVQRPQLTTWRTIDMIPYAHHKEVIEKCLDYAGVTFTSDFLDTTRAKNILFGYGGGELPEVTAGDINLQKVDIDNGDFSDSQSQYPTTIFLPNVAGQSVNANFNSVTFDANNFTYTETQDTLDQYEDAVLYPQQTGNFNLQFTIGIDWAYGVGAMTWQTSQNPTIEILRNGAVIASSTNATYWTLGGTVGQAQNGTTTYSFSQNFYFQAGDVVETRIKYSNCIASHSGTNENITLTVTTSTNATLDLQRLDTAITDGSIIRLGQFLPPIKCSDYLLSGIRQSNLYLSDPDIYEETTIEPLSDFYGDTDEAEDITQLIDHSKDFKVTPTANNYAKDIKFMYKPMTDHDAGVYRERWEEEYGDYTYTQGSYYAKGEQKIQLIWSTIVPYALNDEIIVPRFLKFDANNNAEINKGAPRIMMWNGLKTGAWKLRNADGTGSTNQATYPSVHHFDDYENPTFDLNFRLVQEVFYDTNIVTNVNSWSEYYEPFILEMTNRAGKLIECYIKWNAQDVYRRDFGKLLMINGAVFRLNKIEDFDTDVAETTKIELVKVLEAKNPPARQITYTGDITAPNPNAKSSKKKYTVSSVDYTADADVDEVIEMDTPNTTVTLPTEIDAIQGYEIEIINSSTGKVTIDADPNTIEGDTTFVIKKDEVLQLISNGTQWKII